MLKPPLPLFSYKKTEGVVACTCLYTIDCKPISICISQQIPVFRLNSNARPDEAQGYNEQRCRSKLLPLLKSSNLQIQRLNFPMLAMEYRPNRPRYRTRNVISLNRLGFGAGSPSHVPRFSSFPSPANTPSSYLFLSPPPSRPLLLKLPFTPLILFISQPSPLLSLSLLLTLFI